MAGSLAFAWAANSFGGGNVRSSRAKVSSAVDDLVSVAKSGPPLERARPAPVERLEMCSVVFWQHEEPTKTIQIAVVGMPRRGFQVRLGRELCDEPFRRSDHFLHKALDPRAAHVRGGRSGLAGPARRAALGQSESRESNPSLDDEKVGRHLTEPPVVI